MNPRSASLVSRRRALQLGSACAALAASPWLRAQSGQPLKLIVGFAAGGSTDNAARLVAEPLRAALNRPVVVENRAGAGGRLMLEQAKAAKPEDTLVYVPHGAMTLFPHIYRGLRYRPGTDYQAVARVCTGDFSFATGPATTARTLKDYLAWARDPANKAAYGTPGAGTVPHFLGQMLAQRTQVQMVHAPYRGAAPAVVDVMGGALSMAVTPLADVLPQLGGGKVRVLATAGSQRSSFVPNVPTLRESGVDLEVEVWFGLYALAGAPAALTDTVAEAVRKAAPSLKEPLARMGLVAAPLNGAELSQIQKTESAFWAKAVKDSGFEPEN